MGGRGQYSSRSGVGLSSEEVSKVNKYSSYIEKGYEIYTPKDLNDIRLIEKAYDKSISNANDIKSVNIKDGYHTWNVLPHKTQVEQNGGSSDLYAAHSGKLGGWYKVGETKTAVHFVSSSAYKRNDLNHPLKVSKSEYAKEKASNLKAQKENTMRNLRTDAMYKLAKSEKIKVTRKNTDYQLRTAIRNSGNTELIKKAKKYKLFDF